MSESVQITFLGGLGDIEETVQRLNLETKFLF